MNRKDPEYKKFKKEFWKWFDQLPKYEKRALLYYKEDIAETRFYFKEWKDIEHGKTTNKN